MAPPVDEGAVAQEPEGAGGSSAAGKRRVLLRTLAFAVILVVALAVAVFTASRALDGRSVDELFTQPVAGQQPERLGPISGGEEFALPDVVLPGFLDGPDVRLRDYQGDPLLLNFFASWCAPCVREMPMLQDLSEEAEGRVAFLGVNLQDAPDRARELIAEVGTTYDLASDPNGEFFRQVRGFGMPTTLLVDERGVVRYRHTGELTAQQLRDLIAAHLGVDV